MTYAAGASASIMKTLKEIEKIVGGKKLPPSGPKRSALRQKLQAVLIKSSRMWYGRGFSRGHMESFRAHKHHDCVPTTIAVEVERKFIPKTKSQVKLKSKLSKSFQDRA